MWEAGPTVASQLNSPGLGFPLGQQADTGLPPVHHSLMQAPGGCFREGIEAGSLHGETGQVLTEDTIFWLDGWWGYPSSETAWPSSSPWALKAGMGLPVPASHSPDTKTPSRALPSSANDHFPPCPFSLALPHAFPITSAMWVGRVPCYLNNLIIHYGSFHCYEVV